MSPFFSIDDDGVEFLLDIVSVSDWHIHKVLQLLLKKMYRCNQIVIFVDTKSKKIIAMLDENVIPKPILGYLTKTQNNFRLITTTLLDFFSEGPNVRQEAIKFWT